MYKITIKDSSFKQQQKDLNNLKFFPKLLRILAQSALVKIKDRIQQKGKDSKNTNLKTYSLGYKKVRRQKGLNISFVDLTFTGQMMNALNVIIKSTKEVGVGWLNNSMAQRAEANEKRYGQVFELTQDELDELQKELELEVNKMFNIK